MCNNGEREIELDSRTSDAIAIALRFNCPIYTYEFIINSVGIAIDDDDTNMAIDSEDDYVEKEELAEPINEYAKFTNAQLKLMLQQSLDDENYEKATSIRDELNARKNQ